MALCLPVALSRSGSLSVVDWCRACSACGAISVCSVVFAVVVAGCAGGLFTLNHVSPVHVSLYHSSLFVLAHVMVLFNNVFVVPVCSSDDCSSVIAQCLQWYRAIVARNKERFSLVPVIPYKVSFIVVVPVVAVASQDLLWSMLCQCCWGNHCNPAPSCMSQL